MAGTDPLSLEAQADDLANRLAKSNVVEDQKITNDETGYDDNAFDAYLTATTLCYEKCSASHHRLFTDGPEVYELSSSQFPESLAVITPEDAVESVQAVLQSSASSSQSQPSFDIQILEQSQSDLKDRVFGSVVSPGHNLAEVLDAPPPSLSLLGQPSAPANCLPPPPKAPLHSRFRPQPSRTQTWGRHEPPAKIFPKVERDAITRLNSIAANVLSLKAKISDGSHIAAHVHIKLLDDTLRSLDRSSIEIADIERRKNERRSRAVRDGKPSNIMGAEFDEAKKLAETRLENLKHQIAIIYSVLAIPIPLDSSQAYRMPIDHTDAATALVCVLAVICNVIMGLSLARTGFIVSMVNLIVRTVSAAVLGGSSSIDQSNRAETISRNLPKSLSQALRHFSIDGKFILYATCPSCSFTHKGVQRGNTTHYPHSCDQPILHKDGSSTCNTNLLFTRGDGTLQPIKPYLVGSFSDYLARNLANPTFMQQSKEAMKTARAEKSHRGSRNVFEAAFMKSFRGPDKKLFVGSIDKLCLAFALHFDFFNPNGNRKRGNHDSVGIISAANLALDGDIRYLPEYIFLGSIIPGPKEPTLEEADHFVRPIVEQFVEAWRPGFRISNTAAGADAVVTESAVVLSTNDLPGARKLAGLQGVSSDLLCTMCPLRRNQIHDTNYEDWPRRDPAEMRRLAFAWRDARTLTERNTIYENNGVRWSSLWLLDYWDPTTMLVVDPMHCLLEGIVHYHCRHVLRLDASTKKQNAEGCNFAFDFPWLGYDEYDISMIPEEYTVPEGELHYIDKAHDILRVAISGEKSLTMDQLWTRLNNQVNAAPLRFVAYSLGLCDTAMSVIKPAVQLVWQARVDLALAKSISKGIDQPKQPEDLFNGTSRRRTKAHFIALLLDWHLDQPHQSNKFTVAKISSTLQHIQTVIRGTLTPSWISSVPKNYGEANAGSIKADEWRSLSAIYLPIALVILWGDNGSIVTQENATQFQVLDHTMALFQATNLACRYTMSEDRARAYRRLLKEWVDGLHTAHPHTEKHKVRPNIHAAAHLYDFLLSFGPVVSWWTFPFERLIGAVQKINTNQRIGGVMERTIMMSQTRVGNLRRWLRRADCPEAIKQVKRLFDRAFIAVEKGTSEAVPITKTERRYRAHVTHNGVVFSRKETCPDNSVIIYWPQGISGQTAGQIEQIENMTDGHILLHVRRHLPLPPNQHDPFERYPYFPARTYSTKMMGILDRIHLDDIISHAARYDFSHNRSVICNLSRE